MNSDHMKAQDADIMSESDLAVLDCLQDNLRAPWTEVATKSGLSSITARRHWEEILAQGAAWTSCMPGPGGHTVTSNVEISCHPGMNRVVADELSQHPEIWTVSETTGDFDLRVLVYTHALSRLTDILHFVIGSTQGIKSFRSAVVTRTYMDGSKWKYGALPGHRRGKEAHSPTSRYSVGDADVQKVLKLLENDARTPTWRIAETLKISEGHARRLVKKLLNEHVLVQRIDTDFYSTTWPYALILYFNVPSPQLNMTAETITSIRGVKLCCGLAGGPANLMTVISLKSLDSVIDLESKMISKLPLNVVQRSVIVRHHKRSGHLFDQNQQRSGFISWAGPRQSFEREQQS